MGKFPNKGELKQLGQITNNFISEKAGSPLKDEGGIRGTSVVKGEELTMEANDLLKDGDGVRSGMGGGVVTSISTMGGTLIRAALRREARERIAKNRNPMINKYRLYFPSVALPH